MARRKSKVNFPHLLISVLFIILLIGGGIFFAKTYNPPTSDDYAARGEGYLEGLQGTLGADGVLQDSSYWDWIDEHNTLLPLRGKQFFLGTVSTETMGKYGKISSKNLSKVNNTFFKPLLATSTEYYAQSKFIESTRNMKKNVVNPLSEVYRGFEKGPIKCLLRLTPQSDPFGYFFCGVIDQEQIQMQQKLKSLFSTMYNPKKYYSFRVSIVQEPFARGSLSESILGYDWIAKKTNSKWKIVWKGSEIATCSEMERLAIPKTIYQKCVNE